MPEHTDYAKIHEGCGGVIRWVEAIDQPGVGWTGECRHCGDERITIEEMLPIPGLDVETAFKADREWLAELRWNDEDTWRKNQKRLNQQVFRDAE